jgi:hypothetical protein
VPRSNSIHKAAATSTATATTAKTAATVMKDYELRRQKRQREKAAETVMAK